jgi:hypothetical protein
MSNRWLCVNLIVITACCAKKNQILDSIKGDKQTNIVMIIQIEIANEIEKR